MPTQQTIAPPTREVIQAFGVDTEPVLLDGGEGQSYRAGNIVLKPAGNNNEVSWNAKVLGDVREDGFRVNKPVKTTDGKWVYQGWQAFYFIEGKAIRGRWEEKIKVSRKFHIKLSKIDRPDFIGRRNTPWEVADRVVWNVVPEKYGKKVRTVTDRLLTVKQPLRLTEQLIHGDMNGNILFSDSLAPAIIDFSPYWRPAEYATAIIILDAIVWEGASDTLLSEMKNNFTNNQLLIRAALWRIKTTDEFSRLNNTDPSEEMHHYSHFVDVFLKRIESQANSDIDIFQSTS